MRQDVVTLAGLGLLCFLALAAPARAQSLDGLVVLKSGAPVPYADVQVCPASGGGCLHSTSDRRGHFQVPKLNAGAYRVVVKSRGGSAEGAVRVAAGKTSYIKIGLDR